MEFSLSAQTVFDLSNLHRGTRDKKVADKLKGIKFLTYNIIIHLFQNFLKSMNRQFTTGRRNIWKLLRYRYSLQVVLVIMWVNWMIKKHLTNWLNKSRIVSCQQIKEYVDQEFGLAYSVSGINKLPRRLSFSFKQLSLFPSKLDVVNQSEFVALYRQLENNLSD